MKYIDDHIRLAISNLKQVCVTNKETGRRLGISGKHVGQILSGEVQSVRDNTWKEHMEPILRPLLKTRQVQIPDDMTDIVKKLAEEEGVDVDQYLRKLIRADMVRHEQG